MLAYREFWIVNYQRFQQTGEMIRTGAGFVIPITPFQLERKTAIALEIVPFPADEDVVY